MATLTHSASTPELTVIEPRGAGPIARFQEVWRHRHLLNYFAIETIRRTYRATVLGWLWLLIRPLFPVVITTFVFHELAGINSGPIPYFLFILVGTAIWGLFEEGLIWVTRSLQMYRRLLTKLYFPRAILPAASTGPALLELLIHIALIIIVALYILATSGKFHLTIGLHTFAAFAAVLMAFSFVLAIGWFTSVLGSEKRDIRFTLRYVLRFWYYLTPVVYPASMIPEQWRWLSAINPMTAVVELFRWGIFGPANQPPDVQILPSVITIAVTFGLGFWYFASAEGASIDRI